MAANDLIQVLAAKFFGLPVLSAAHEGRDAVRPKRAGTTLQKYNFFPQTRKGMGRKAIYSTKIWLMFHFGTSSIRGGKLFAFSKMGLEKAVIIGQVM